MPATPDQLLAPNVFNIPSIELHRMYRDTCKGNFPEGLKLQFTWADIKLPKGTNVTVKNRVTSAFLIKKSANVLGIGEKISRCLSMP